MSSTSSLTSTTSSASTNESLSFAGLDLSFLSRRDRARFERRANRAYRKSKKAASLLDAAPKHLDTVPQVCSFKLVSLKEAQNDDTIRYRGILAEPISAATVYEKVPQVCTLKLVSLKEAQESIKIRYCGFL